MSNKEVTHILHVHFQHIIFPVSGFEQNAIEYFLEENIALVTFGQETKIVQHLTNDFNQIRDHLGEIIIGSFSRTITFI